MRIVAGTLGGRLFEAPKGYRTHPMSDKIRGALFNILGDITDLTVLDAFAGSGAVGFEAISRGAKSVVAIDSDRQATQSIGRNVVSLGISQQIKVVTANAGSWSDTNATMTFDIVVCDPPYDHIQTALIAKLSRHLHPGGTLVVSLPPKATINLPEHVQLQATKHYGDSSLQFYRV